MKVVSLNSTKMSFSTEKVRLFPFLEMPHHTVEAKKKRKQVAMQQLLLIHNALLSISQIVNENSELKMYFLLRCRANGRSIF